MNDPQAKPAVSNDMGRHERDLPVFEKLAKASNNGEIQTIDIKVILPDYIGADKLVAAHVLDICRRSLDDMLTQNKGVYCYRKAAASFDIHFDEIPAASAKVKIGHATETIKESVKRKAENKDEPQNNKPKDDKKGYGNEALARIMREGLGTNPTLEEVLFWIERLMPNIQHAQGKTPLTPDLINLVKASDIFYYPLVNGANQIIAGGLATIKPPCAVSQYNTGEATRQHLAMFASACGELFRLATKQEQALVTVPISCNDLQNETITNLYLCMLRKMSPDFKKNLVFEVTHLPKGALSPTLKATIQTLSQFCKTLMVESGLLNLATIDPIFKAHACGFDVASFNLPAEELGRLIQKFADHYKKQNLKTYIKNAHNPAALAAANQNGLTYACGTAVRAAGRACPSIQKLGAATPPPKG